MSHVLGEDLIYEVLSVVEEIPEGKVASYGQIARLIGREKNARLVGRILSWRHQRELLEAEGVTFRDNGCVDMKQFQWEE